MEFLVNFKILKNFEKFCITKLNTLSYLNNSAPVVLGMKVLRADPVTRAR